jgi:hypothetical protein
MEGFSSPDKNNEVEEEEHVAAEAENKDELKVVGELLEKELHEDEADVRAYG